MAFRKDQVVLWPLVGFWFEINDDHACFFEDKIIFFFTASAFFQAALLPVASGERRQSISACLALYTAALQSAFHQGRRGSFGGLEFGHVILKN